MSHQVQISFNSTTAQTLVAADTKNDIHPTSLSIRNTSGGSLEYQLLDTSGNIWFDVDFDPTKNPTFVCGLGFHLTPAQQPLKVKTPTAGASVVTLTYELANTYIDPTAP